jgi:hypothetical protein
MPALRLPAMTTPPKIRNRIAVPISTARYDGPDCGELVSLMAL